MLLNELHRFTAWLSHSIHKSPANGTTPAAPNSVFDFDPMWHGDHWQNLLSSPMDARHYVMEDWSVAGGADFATAELASEIR